MQTRLHIGQARLHARRAWLIAWRARLSAGRESLLVPSSAVARRTSTVARAASPVDRVASAPVGRARVLARPIKRGCTSYKPGCTSCKPGCTSRKCGCPGFRNPVRGVLAEGRHHFGGSLDELDEDALAAAGSVGTALRMDEAHVESPGPLADTAGREAHALRAQPLDCGREVVHPEADVVERGIVHGGTLAGVD